MINYRLKVKLFYYRLLRNITYGGIIMKKNLKVFVLAGILSVGLMAGCSQAGANESANIDSISSASVAQFYESSSIKGEELMNAINERSGAVAIATTNEDGTPNIATIVPPAVDENTLMFQFADNQTKVNLEERDLAVLSYYIYMPEAEEKADRNSGARLILKLITDEAKISELSTKAEAPEGVTFMEIVKVLPLG